MNNLPQELLEYLVSLLDADTAMRLGCVSRIFASLLTEQVCASICQRDFPPIPEYYAGWRVTIGEILKNRTAPIRLVTTDESSRVSMITNGLSNIMFSGRTLVSHLLRAIRIIANDLDYYRTIPVVTVRKVLDRDLNISEVNKSNVDTRMNYGLILRCQYVLAQAVLTSTELEKQESLALAQLPLLTLGAAKISPFRCVWSIDICY